MNFRSKLLHKRKKVIMEVVSLKKLTILLSAALLFLLTSVTVSGQSGEYLNLRDSITQALANNPAAKLATLRIEQAEVNYESLTEQIDFAREKLNTVDPVPNEDELFRLLITGPDAAEQAKLLAVKRSERDRSLLVMEVQSNYLALHKAYEQKKLAELKLERAREQKRVAEAKFGVGAVAKSDVLYAESQVSLAEAQFFAVENGVKLAEITLNKTLGRELNEPLFLEEQFSLPEVGEPDLERGLISARENTLEVISARSNLVQKESALRYAKYASVPGDPAYLKAELDVEEAKLGVQVAQDNVSVEVHQLYNSLSGMEKQLTALEKSVQYARESYDMAVLRYEIGLATQTEVSGALLTLSDLEAQLLQAKYDRYLGWLRWLLTIGRIVE
jgi:outer membrane protein TolC